MNHSHLTLAHQIWERVVTRGDHVIDATCGNGYDALHLANLVGPTGSLSLYDIQKEALQATQKRLQKAPCTLHLHNRSHAQLEPLAAKLIVYNLGYLPGGDKTLTTQTTSTLESLKSGLDLLQPNGMISLTLYPGHPEGAKEAEAVLKFVGTLDRKEWNCSHHTWLNRQAAPSLLLIERP